jgi:hypothetical protein
LLPSFYELHASLLKKDHNSRNIVRTVYRVFTW